MISRGSLYLVSISCVAGLSFAAGRLLPTPPMMPAPKTTAKPQAAEPALPVVATTTVPDRLPNLIAMRFPETYALFKAAPLEAVWRYYNELVSLRPKPVRRAALASFFKALVHVDPNLTKELILQLKGDDKWAAIDAIRGAAPPRGMHSAAEVLLSLDRSQISGCSWDMLGDALDDWGKNDPLALKQFLQRHRDQDVERYYGKFVQNWAAYDPQAAWQWISEEIQKRPIPPELASGSEDLNPDSSWRHTASGMLSAWVEGFVEHNPDAAIQYVLQHQSAEHVSAAACGVAAKLFTISPDQARDLVLQLSDADLRAGALERIAEQADRFVSGGASDNITSPRFIAEWLLKVPIEGGPQRALEKPLREWKHANPGELFAWITELPTAWRADVVLHFPVFVFSEKPSEDFDLIMQAPDPVLRQELLEVLMRSAKHEREGLLGVLEHAQLTAPQRAHLASLIPAPEEPAEADAEN